MDQVCFTSTAIPAFNAYSEELGTQNECWVWKLCKVLLQSLFKVTVLIPTSLLFVKLFYCHTVVFCLAQAGLAGALSPCLHLVPTYLNTAARGSLRHAGHYLVVLIANKWVGVLLSESKQGLTKANRIFHARNQHGFCPSLAVFW